jgi:hypothetical protein
LAESLEVVQQTSMVILAALENPLEQKAQEEAATEPAREPRRARHSRPQSTANEEHEAIAEVA